MPGPRASAFPARAAAVRALVALGAAALLVAPLAGCQRRPRFVPAAADSSGTAPADSLADRIRILQDRWAAPGAGPEAAGLTAGVLLDDLRARAAADPEASWEERARFLLDSLDVGAETAGAPCALAVDFFPRSDPTAGSWPWVFWCGPAGIAAQAVEGQGMSLVALASRGLAPPGGTPPAPAPPGVAALLGRRAGTGTQPLLLVWRAGPRLELQQTLGPDSLGGVGTGGFEAGGDSGAVLAVRTWRSTPRFDECPTCPHVVHERRFRWGRDGFARTSDRVVPSPYVAFVRLIQALTSGDEGAAQAAVAEPGLVESARAAGWAVLRGPWRVAPGTAEGGGDEMVFFRGSTEAWRVTFARRGEEWVVSALAPASRAIE